jgi:hypothetical protein
MTNLQDEEIIRDKLHFFSDRDIAVHIVLKTILGDGKNKWHNGKTIKYFDNYVEFDDEKQGLVPIYFSQILDILKREEKK